VLPCMLIMHCSSDAMVGHSSEELAYADYRDYQVDAEELRSTYIVDGGQNQ
jgi:hypothetical protein